jgi:hypothetical protein
MVTAMRNVRKNQCGNGDIGMLVTVLIASSLISGIFLTLQWIKATKDARYVRQVQTSKMVNQFGEPGYAVTYLPGICGKDPCGK